MMQYAAMNAVRVLLAYTVTAVFCWFFYPRLFSFQAVAFVFAFYAFSFIHLPGIGVLKRILLITLTVAGLLALYLASVTVYVYLSTGHLPPNLDEGALIFAIALFGPHYVVFLTSYLCLELPLKTWAGLIDQHRSEPG
ncbi:hypothetical protein [Ensifer sp.]|uniref:hypothetical protein n=1 Tax=Ensifer sp. TaxID=1872086 RepID=UPI002899BA74|nr:hypothetical protein [Ensifer sp.]